MKKILLLLKQVMVVVFVVCGLQSCCILKRCPDPEPVYGNVHGKITDKAGNSLENVKVVLQPNTPNGEATTQSDGSFKMTNITVGDYYLEATKRGYIKKTTSIFPIAKDMDDAKSIMLFAPIEIDPANSLEFGANGNISKFSFRNNLEQSVDFSIIVNNKGWFTVEPTSGKIPPNGSLLPITVTLNRSGIPAGSYTGSLTINFEKIEGFEGQNYLINFGVANAEAPSVVSEKPTNITPTSCQISGTITGIGKGTVTKFGHVWSESPNPVCCKPGSYTDLGASNVGSFVSNVTGLIAGRTYYIRAYAENEKGINYSFNNEFTFVTPTVATGPSVSMGTVTVTSPTTAKLTGKINDNGGSKIVEYGHVWSKTNPNPDPRNETTKTVFSNEPTNGEFISNLTNLLEANSTYYVAAYAKNSSNTPWSVSSVITLNTPVPVTEPKLSTSSASNIDYTSATLKGSISDLGSVKIVEHGFVYSKSNADPKVNAVNSTYKSLGSLITTGSIESNITGLFKGTSYYFRTYVKTDNNNYYYSSSVKTFTTKEDNLVYFWTFNDSGFGDVSSRGNDAEGSAKPASDRFNNANKAMDLSAGSISEVQYSQLTSDVSVSFWIKPSDANFSGNKKVIYGHTNDRCNSGASFTGFLLYFDSNITDGNSLLLNISNNGTQSIKPVLNKDDIDLDKWQQIVLVKSGNNWKVYANGEQKASLQFNININLNGGSGSFNKSFLGFPWYRSNFYDCYNDDFSKLNGLIDDVRRYDKAFSESDVKELYNREK